MAKLKLLCPRCGSDNLGPRGASDPNQREVSVQRWNCKNKNCPTKGGWHGTRPVNIELYEQFPERFEDEEAAIPRKQVNARVRELNAYKRENDVATFVVTAAQNATPIHENFLENLLTLAEDLNGQPIVIPFRYRNPTSHWSQQARSDDWWAKEVLPFCVNHRFSLNRKVEVLADIKTQPTATDPLSSMESMTGPKWGVVGHTKLRLKCVPTLPGKPAKVMVTTGACTIANYTPTKAGKKGEFHHVLGATVVQTRGTRAFMYQIVADSDGSFIHRDRLYQDGQVFEAPRALALVLGDSHVDFIDAGVTKATFGPERGMCDVFKPEYLVWHDLNDFYAGSHHHDRPDMFFTRLAKHSAGRADIRAELTRAFDYVNQNAPEGCHNVFPYSNHGNEHLWKWLNSKDPREDYVNFGFWLETWRHLHSNMNFGKAGAETIDPFAFWGVRMLERPEDATFLGPNDSFTLKQVDVGAHGHLGPNGARATVNNLARMGHKTITGHGHAPEIFEGHVRVGKSAGDMEYERGPGSGMRCHGVLYANGKRALYFIDGEEWEF